MTSPLVQSFDVPLMPVVGAVRSILTAALSAVVVLPALSLTDWVALSAAPSPVIVLLAGGADWSPDNASEALHPMVTSSLYQPLALAEAVGVPVSVGAVLSMLMSLIEALAELSALSTALPGTDWPAPSVDSRTDPPPVQLLMPESASVQVKPTVTSVLFQPNALGAGALVPLMAGLVLSSFTSTEPLPVLPSLSAAVAVLVTPAVSAVTLSVAGVGPEPMPEPVSAADQVIAAFALRHPAALAAGVTVAFSVGPVLSSVYDACAEPELPVHLPCPLKLGEAEAVTVCVPSPAPAVVVNVQLDCWLVDCA